jgi:diamine N-acetyltransferase
MKSVKLQKCSFKDIPQLRQLALQSYQEHYMYLWTEEKYAWWYMDISFSEQSLQQQINTPGSDFFFVLYNEVPIGFLKLNSYKSPGSTHPNQMLELERIYLLKETTGKSIGSRAVQMVINKAKEDHVQAISLKSMDSSKAVQFYEKMGFKIINTEILPFDGFKDEYRKIHTMILDL